MGIATKRCRPFRVVTVISGKRDDVWGTFSNKAAAEKQLKYLKQSNQGNFEKYEGKLKIKKRRC